MKKFPEIPGYKFMKAIGSGGMADVYLAVQKKLDRMVAIKVMQPEIFRSPVTTKRFVREAKTLSKLVHPNIITVFDVGKVEDTYYIVMEYLHGSLKDKIEKQRKIPPAEALQIVRQVADALYYAHKIGFIHRDVKPDNILFRKDGTPVVVDFGIARPVDTETRLTKTGMSIGTPNYISPEQARGQKVDGRSDIYSLGVVLYEMLTGKLPYKSENTLGVVIKHLQEPVPKLTGSLKQYQALLDKMMSKEKSKRVRSKKELDEITKSFMNNDPIKVTKPVRRKKAASDMDKTQMRKSVKPSGSGTVAVLEKPREKRSLRYLWLLLPAILIGGIVFSLFYLQSAGRLYRDLDTSDVRSVVMEGDFYDNVWNRYGNYRAQYQSETIGNMPVLVDRSLDLMWHPSGSPVGLKFRDAEKWLVDLNKRGYAGHKDWRLPTLREAASLLRTRKGEGGLFIDPAFSGKQTCIWTGDVYGNQEAWAVRFDEGYTLHLELHTRNFIRPVRGL
jgi:serine/threonine protein kinase